MKFNLKKHRKYLLAGGLLLATATPSFALFGIGDIVFDPTSYASLVSQLTTLESQYNMLKNNVTHFSFKQQWQTTLNQLKNVNVANMFGETAGVNIALNSNSPSASLTAWKTATLPVSSWNDHLPARADCRQQYAQLSQLAMIEMSDSVSPDCLTAVGQYRAGRSQNGTANQLSHAAAVRYHVGDEQRGPAVEPSECRSSPAVDRDAIPGRDARLPCLSDDCRQHAAAERRSTADLNTAAAIQQQRSTNDTSAANEGSTWTTYLP